MSWKVKTLDDLKNQDIPGVVVADDGREFDYIGGCMTIMHDGKRYPVIRSLPGLLDRQIAIVMEERAKEGKRSTATVRFACREGPEGIEELVYEGPGRMIRMVSPETDSKLLPVCPESLPEAIKVFQGEN